MKIDRQPKEDRQYVESSAPDLNLELVEIPAGRFLSDRSI